VGGDAEKGYKTKKQTVNYKREGCTKCGDPSCDGWHAKDQSDLRMIPRQDAFLFQKAGIDPDLSAHKAYKDKLHEYKNQPTHRTTDMGFSEIEEPQFQVVPLRNEKGEHVHEEQELDLNGTLEGSSLPGGIKKIQRPVFQRVPVLDESGNHVVKKKQVRNLESILIPESERIAPPSDDEFNKAKADYQASYDSALEKAYPGMGKEEALGKLAEEHKQRVLNLEVIRNKSQMNINRKIQASKEEEGQRPVFNASKL